MASRHQRAAIAACAVLVACATFAPRLEIRASTVATAPIPRGRPFTPHTPSTAVHTDFMVETNRKGQVTRVKSGKSCNDLAFNAMTYGNALQTFIRTTDGRAIPGIYRLSYDFDPHTQKVHRSVALVKAGGVDPNKQSAVDEMNALARRHREAAPPPPSPLPDFKAITGHHH